MPARKNIVLGVTGSIAAYKAADLASLLVKRGHDVFVIMTESAQRFITPLTLQTLSKNPVMTHVFAEQGGWIPGHIEWADRADLLLIAPASAATIARLAQGLAEDALTCVALATRAPLVIAPAMNGKMWSHPATTRNADILRERGAIFFGPDEGLLACGYEGAGRLWPVEDIAAKADEILLRS
jgi:phosphopantothenoylcysteine synthetase/decarboxylase